MKTKLLVSLVVFIMALVLNISVQAEADITQVTTNSYEDSFPHIKGNYLVWQGRVGGDWEIFLYNIATGATIQITDNDYDDISPQTDGNYVVWLGFSFFGGEIFLYDISSKTTSQITDDSTVHVPPDYPYPNLDASPRIANSKVVWISYKVMDSVEPGEIYLYDIAATSPTKTCLSVSVDPGGTLDDGSPRINDKSVMWLQADGVGNTTTFLHDLATGNTAPAPADYSWPDRPITDGGLTVLTRYDGSDREISVYNNCAKTYEQITDNGLEDSNPRISGNYAAWVCGEGEASEVWLVSGLPIVPCADSGCDIDEDGVCGDVDNCPRTPNPGQEDLDGDGVGDECDSCPNDPGKTEPGICGCGVADTDSDGDGIPDCNENDGSDDDEGLCFIATAAFGSYVDPHVKVLKDFRDEYLLTNMPGRWFVNIYKTYGPMWADRLNAHPGYKPFVRLALMPLVGISCFVLNTSLATKLLTGFLLLGFIPICLLRIRGRSVTCE